MLESLRTRFILSHALPILLLLPLLSFVLLYLLETRYLTANLANEMVVQAALIGEMLQSDPAVWQDEQTATQRVSALQQRLPKHLPTRIMLLDRDGNVLASNLAADAGQIGLPVNDTVEQRALAGETAWDLRYSAELGEQVVDVAVPVFGEQNRVLGVVRLSHSIAQIEERRVPLRWFVLGTFAVGVVVAVALSIVLAGSLSASLLRLTRAMARFSIDAPPEVLPITGSREMRTLVARYNEIAQQLYKVEMARRRLLAGVVHEVSRPLGGINAAAQLLRRREQPDPDLVHELAGEIEVQVQDIRLQMDDLTLLAQSERGEFQLHFQAVDVAELFAARCGRVVARIRAEGLAIETHFAPDLPPVYADPSRIAQVLCNLLDNARKYSDPGEPIQVAAALEPSAGGNAMLAIRVRDAGPGIAPEEQERIFQFFYRNPTQGRVRDGMGIGLGLGRQLALAHGGTLHVESVPGQGATFVLRLPVYSAPS